MSSRGLVLRILTRTLLVGALGALGVLPSCGSSGGDGAGGSSSEAGTSTEGGSDTPDGGGALPDAAPASDLGGVFRHGMNSGHVNPNFTDEVDGWLGVQAGADSNRITLPESFLAQWGVGIRTGAAQSYFADGMSNLVCFLIGPTAAHSTAPSADQLDQFIPKNLYEPIFAADGAVNPNNYWAKYVEQTVTTYKPWVHIWEVWNEPDWVSDYTITQKWTTTAPTAADLPRFNGSIYDYVRMLRITTVVAKRIDPAAQIALGGIGYPTFLGALLRSTDEPSAGAVSAEFPQKGGAYFDVLNFHYYPLYTPGNSDAAAARLLAQKAEMAKVLAAAGVTGKSWNATETGAPRFAFGTSPGGVEYAKNYLLKAMLLAHLDGMIGLDWFLLADGAKVSASQDPYAYMGLYENTTGLTDKTAAVKTPTGVAYATLGRLLKGATTDPARTASLALPQGVGGGAFRAASGKTVLALWAKAASGEAATGSYALSATSPVTVHAWDGSATGATTTVTPQGGKATLDLVSTPTFFELP
jgi:hypothetical protein